ncbi:MAG: Rab geranylgeranyltransferase [Bathelium mastoideum]|nr:MAG: Rab geranylgeranyltransferase [Bathelium mastoideum]
MSSHGIPRTTAATEQSRQQELAAIERYQELTALVHEKVSERDFSSASLDLTAELVSKNPEYYTIWNYRRLILLQLFDHDPDIGNSNDLGTAKSVSPRQKNVENLITSDLQFEVPLLRKYPKCYWLWNHRDWLLRQAQNRLPKAFALQLWGGELILVGKMLTLDSRNFHGWGYRRKVVAKVEELQGTSMAEAEFEYTTKVIRTNLSNFSAWHYRSKLIPRILADRKADDAARQKLLDDEFKIIQRGLWTDPYDQSLWGYHQFLVKTVVFSSEQESFIPNLSNGERLTLLEREIRNTDEMLEGAEDCKWIYQALLQYSEMYLELDTGNKTFTTQDMRSWLDQLKKLDTLRVGRWNDLEKKLNI